MSVSPTQFLPCTCTLPCANYLGQLSEGQNHTTVNVDSPSVLLGGCGILLDGNDIMQVDLKPHWEFRGLNAVALSQLVPVLSHSGRLAGGFFLVPAVPFAPSLPHTLASGCETTLVSSEKLGMSVITCGRSITEEPEVLSSCCLWHAYKVFKLPWDNAAFNLGETDKKIKLMCSYFTETSYKTLRYDLLTSVLLHSLALPASQWGANSCMRVRRGGHWRWADAMGPLTHELPSLSLFS